MSPPLLGLGAEHLHELAMLVSGALPSRADCCRVLAVLIESRNGEMIFGVPGESTHGSPRQYANKRNGGAFGSEDDSLVGGVGLKGNRAGVGCETATLPNTRMQRTRSSPSALRSPLMRCPLGRRVVIWSAPVAALLGLLLGWRQKPVLAHDLSLDQMRSAIEQLVPMNTDVEVARKTMEKEAFVCEVKLNMSWNGGPKGPFLWCDRREDAGASTIRRWNIAFPLNGQKIAGVRLSEGLIGP